MDRLVSEERSVRFINISILYPMQVSMEAIDGCAIRRQSVDKRILVISITIIPIVIGIGIIIVNKTTTEGVVVSLSLGICLGTIDVIQRRIERGIRDVWFSRTTVGYQ